MGDYFLAEQLARQLGLTERELEHAQRHGLIQPVQKNGRLFYTSHHAYRLKAAASLMRKRRLTWEEATTQLGNRPLYQVSGR